MRKSILSQTHLLFLILATCIVCGEQTVFAQQGKKVFTQQGECVDQPVLVSPSTPKPKSPFGPLPPGNSTRKPFEPAATPPGLYLPPPPFVPDSPNPNFGDTSPRFLPEASSFNGSNNALAEEAGKKVHADPYPGRFDVDLSTGINRYLVYTKGGQLIYEGSDLTTLSRILNREIEGLPVSTIHVAPTGLPEVQQDFFVRELSKRLRRINPNLAIVGELTKTATSHASSELEDPLVSPGARLPEDSTFPSIACGTTLCEASMKAEKDGKIGRVSFFNRDWQSLRAFLYSFYPNLSKDLRHMSFERIIKRAIEAFKKTHPGTEIDVQFTTETGGTRWVYIPPLPSLLESCVNS
jgi:hypothetical protein